MEGKQNILTRHSITKPFIRRGLSDICCFAFDDILLMKNIIYLAFEMNYILSLEMENDQFINAKGYIYFQCLQNVLYLL